MRGKPFILLAAALWLLAAAPVTLPASTTATVGAFNITFYGSREGDGSGTTGARRTNWTTTEMTDVQACVATWANRIANVPGRQVQLHMFWHSWTDNTLGATSAPTNGDGTTSWTYVENAWRNGKNYSGPWAISDCTMQFSTTAANTAWNFGTGTPSSSQIDFRSVITHEIGHALGFYPSYSSDDTWGNCYGTSASPDNFAGYFGLSNWDKFLVDSSGNHPVKSSTGTPGNFNQVANPVYFTGPNAVAYYGGNVPIYAPNPYEAGSSLSHLDETLLPNALMSPEIAPGEMVRKPTRLEWEIMKDLGWNVITTLNWDHGAGTLNWTDAANWDNPSAPPDATWDVVLTSTGLADGSTINLGGNGSVNVLTIDSTAGFTLGGTSGTLTLVKGNLTRTAASSGAQTLARPIALQSSAVWDIDGTGQLAVTGGISGAGVGIEKRSAGTLVFSGANTYSGPTSIQGGTLVLSGGSTASSSFTVAPGATLFSTAAAFTIPGAFSNTGTLRAQGGALTLSGTVSQIVGTTLSGGKWEVDANSSLNITSGAGIATNQATVILDGPNSLFTKFDSVAANQGTLTLLDGRTLATAADFSNSGAVTIGTGSVLEVAGNYTQTAGDTAVGGQLKADAGWADILGGTMELDADAGANGAVLSLDVVGATVYFDSNQHLDALDIGAGGKVVFRGAKLVVLNNFQIDGLSFGPMTLTPEPTTFGLLAFGGLALVWRQRRKHSPRKRGG